MYIVKFIALLRFSSFSLRAPYPLPAPGTQLRKSFWVGLFVFAFLFIFQPFGISISSVFDRALICFGYGLITFMGMLIFMLASRRIFPSWFQTSSWTLSTEILYSLGIIWLIGLLNLLYSAWIFSIPLNWSSFLGFQGYTLGIGVFPVVAMTYLNYTRLDQRNIREAQLLRRELVRQTEAPSARQQSVYFSSELKEAGWELDPEQFLFAETADNYVQLYARTDADIERRMLRTNLSTMEQEAQAFPFLMRTHRSYFVNLHQVEDFSGNAQGLKLRLHGLERDIPVSRKLVDTIKQQLV